jgi:hypothetical protein
MIDTPYRDRCRCKGLFCLTKTGRRNMDQFVAILPQLIIGIGTAAGTIVGVLKTNGSKMDRLSEGMTMVSRDINRLTLHDEHLSIEERLAAGERYIKGGGNGVTRAYYEKLLVEYRGGLKV